MLTGLWFFQLCKGRTGEPAPSSQDLKGWEKQEKDERQHAPCHSKQAFPLSSPPKKLIVIPSSKLTVKKQCSV